MNCSEVAAKATAYPTGALEVGWPFKVVVAKRQHPIKWSLDAGAYKEGVKPCTRQLPSAEGNLLQL